MTFGNPQSWLPIAIALAVLVPLAWTAWRGSESGRAPRGLALTARLLGILLLLFALADPQIIDERPVEGANVLALVADNSAGMRIQDPGSPLDRGESLRQSLTTPSSDWLDRLAETYQLRNYRFDRSLQRLASFQALSFDGEQSNLARALEELRSRLASQPVAGIAVFTDGNATDAATLPDDLSGLPPIFPVVIGEDQSLPDLALRHASLSQSAFGDSPLQLRASLDSTYPSASAVEAKLRRLRAPGETTSGSLVDPVVESQRLSFPRGSATKELSFEWRPAEAGIQFFELEVNRLQEEGEAPPSEAATENNRRALVADRGEDSYRILYLTGRPNWEYKFLNRSLAQDPQLDIVGLIRVAKREPKFEFKGRAGEIGNPLYRGFGREDENERYDESVLIRMNTRDETELRAGFPNDAEELFAYDAVVIDDLEADFFNFNQLGLLRDFVKQRGGGLLVLGGVNSLEDGGYRDSPLAQALPVYLDGSSNELAGERSVAWSLTRDGWVEPWMRVRASETAERQRLEDMPLLRVYNSLSRVKPGAQVLAEIEDAAALSYPALVTRNFGSGRVAVLAVGDLWRWGMQDKGSQADLAQFWRQLSRWLVKDNPRRVELLAERVPGKGVILSGIARDRDYRPLELGTATVSIDQIHGGGDIPLSLELPMTPAPNRPGQFSVEVPIETSGAYLARLAVTDGEGLPVGEAQAGWVAQPLVEEFASLAPNRTLLQRLAERTGGRVLNLANVDQLNEELRSRPSPVTETYAKPLWHSNWLFLLALACFLAEWFLRRKKGLA